MSRKHNPKSPKHPLQDFGEWQEHRYNPGYWVTKVRNGGLTPLGKSIGGIQLSTFSRTLAIFVPIGTVLIGAFYRFRSSLWHPWICCAAILILLFLGIWCWIKASLRKYGIPGNPDKH